jgi:hypothetical protein
MVTPQSRSKGTEVVAMTAVNIFQPNPSLSYPQFNTYRLSSLPSSSQLTTHSLPSQYVTTASRVASGQPLGFKEIQSRVGWDHLAAGTDQNEVCYVNEGYEVVQVTIEVRI